jgi:predicted regulator of Ras-like GTPase activity (Roadblock/LC7/MglB family)/predicted  nucleic acid-binding Zn-ribbon protein
MFDLPIGKPIKKTITVEDGSIQPFDHGIITTWLGRRKTPSGHRLVRAGRIVAWICENETGKYLITGNEAKNRLSEIEQAGSRLEAQQYSMAGLGSVAEIIPESFEFNADRQGLISSGNVVQRLLSRDLSSVLEKMCQNITVRGAIAVDAGMLIDSVGELPGDAEELAAHVGTTIANRAALSDNLGLNSEGHWTLHTADGALLLAQAGEIAIAAWTEANSDHSRIINAASASIDGELGSTGALGSEIPDGFVMREGKGGPGAVISMLEAAVSEQVTGHIKSGITDNTAVSLVLSKGIPVAISAPKNVSFEESVLSLTDSKKVLKLHRLPAGTLVTSESGNIDDFALADLRDLISTIRTRSESRKETLLQKINRILGFEIGVEALRKSRASAKFKMTADSISKGLSKVEAEPAPAVDSGLRRRLESAEIQIDELSKNNASLKAKLNDANTAKTTAQSMARQVNESSDERMSALEAANTTLNSMQIDLSQAIAKSEDAESRALRLVKRVNELEHQVSQRASELAKALGDSKSSEALSDAIREMALKEAELNSSLDEGSDRLSTIRQQSDDDERRLRVLQEQVETTRERHARAQAELIQLEERIHVANTSLDEIDAESKASRRRTEENRTRLAQDEARQSQVQAELRELMEERRQILRELGDLGARKGQSEAELLSLIDKAEDLSQAHEEALLDIQEAERIRARLAEEPLAQALLDDASTFEGLGPVLSRLETARGLGYSVTLLDRAVERALQVIQSTVDHVATTPRHLLSNEVMSLLERQVPQTAGAVRGLARWSVQQRLEHQLGDTVGHLIVDLENLLEDFDRSITMLRRLRNVLEQLAKLGAPVEEIEALLANCNRPESLPSIAKATHKLIRVALDDIYLEADQRDAGESISLEETARVLEELITQLDASGLADGTPSGIMWEFQRDGLLPYERDTLPAGQRIDVKQEMIEHMEPTLAGDVPVSLDKVVNDEIESDSSIQSDEDGWQQMPTPEDDAESTTATYIAPPTAPTLAESGSLNEEDERAMLEAELARLDAAWDHRNEPKDLAMDPALSALEAKLSGLDM